MYPFTTPTYVFTSLACLLSLDAVVDYHTDDLK